MSILINKFTRVICQGIANRFAQFMALSLCALLSVCHTVKGDDPPKQLGKEQHEKVEQLINQLASKNPEPVNVGSYGPNGTGAKYHFDYPVGWDRKKQEDVYKAIDELTAIGMEAFPQLIEHFDDKRYSYSDDALNGFGNEKFKCSVGRVCLKIIRQMVDVHVIFGGPGDTRTFNYYDQLRDFDDARKWWKANSDRPLWDLQADSLLWAIEKESASKSNPEFIKVESSQEALRKDREKLDKLVTNKQPVSTKPLRPVIDR